MTADATAPAVLLVIDNLEYGGGERGFLQLCRGLAARGRRVGAAGQPGGLFERQVREAGATFFPLDMRRRANPTTIVRLRALVQRERFRLVHSQGARADFVARAALLGLRQVGHVCTVQMPADGFDVSPARRRLYVTADRLLARRVDRFIVVSGALRTALVEGRGIAAEKVEVIPNGVETAAPAAAAALGLPPEDRLIGAIGRLVWQKGFEHAVRAMPSILEGCPSARLVIVGDGPLRAALGRTATAASVASRVTFLGFRADVPAVLKSLEVLVVPSLREGFPMITLEAMASGTPLVATAIPGIVEQARHETEALLVEPGDASALAMAASRLLADRSLAATLAEAARRRVRERFAVERMVDATRRVYAELAEQPA